MSQPVNTVKKPVSIKKTILRVLLYFVVLDVCVITLYPYFAMLCTALKNRVEIFSGGTVLPVVPLWSNFIDIWSRAPMAKYMLNSVLIAGGSTIIAMLCGIPAAYALARMKFKGQTAFLGFVIVSQMFAPVVLLIGIYQVMQRLGLTDNILGLIFINAWNEYTVALCLISTDDYKPLTVGINTFNGYDMIEWQYLFAASIFAIIPVVILFMSIEKNLVSGLASGGVKG